MLVKVARGAPMVTCCVYCRSRDRSVSDVSGSSAAGTRL